MKFGLRYCNTGRYVDAALAVEIVQAAEEAGFESAWDSPAHRDTGKPRLPVSVFGGRGACAAAGSTSRYPIR